MFAGSKFLFKFGKTALKFEQQFQKDAHRVFLLIGKACEGHFVSF